MIAARAEAATDTYVESRLAGDEVFVSSEKAIARLLDGFEISPYDFVGGILADEFSDHISLDERSIELRTYTLLEELQSEFKDVELSEEYLNTNEGVILKLVVSRSDCRIFRRIWPLTDYRLCATTSRLSGLP